MRKLRHHLITFTYRGESVVGVVLKTGRTVTVFDIARGTERACRGDQMHRVRVVQFPAVYGSKNEADAYAGGWERGLPGQRAIPLARLQSGLPELWAVLSIEEPAHV